MGYFLLTQDPLCTDAPQIINWYEKIDKKNIATGKSRFLKKRTLLEVSPNKNLVYPPILTNPFFLVSKEVKNSIDLYEKKMIYKEIVLLDSQNMNTAHYFMPILPKIDCLSNESTFNLDHSIVKDIIVRKDKILENKLFLLDNMLNQHIIIHTDLIESILRKISFGIALKQAKETYYGEHI